MAKRPKWGYQCSMVIKKSLFNSTRDRSLKQFKIKHWVFVTFLIITIVKKQQ